VYYFRFGGTCPCIEAELVYYGALVGGSHSLNLSNSVSADEATFKGLVTPAIRTI